MRKKQRKKETRVSWLYLMKEKQVKELKFLQKTKDEDVCNKKKVQIEI